MNQAEAVIALEILNVGFGQSIIAYPVGEKAPLLVIDGGDDRPEIYSRSTHATPLQERLRRLGAQSIDLMIATHPHRDHIGGLAQVAEAFPVGRLATFFDLPPAPIPAGEGNMHAAIRLYGEMLAALRRQRTEILLPLGGGDLHCGGIKIKVYPPNAALLEQARSRLFASAQSPEPEKLDRLSAMLNGVCMNLRLDLNGVGVFLPADTPLSQWEEVSGAELAAQIMTAPHHGDADCLSPALLKKIGADCAVISADTAGTYGLPNPKAAAMLAEGGVGRVLFTAGGPDAESAGGVRFEIAPGGEFSWEYL